MANAATHRTVEAVWRIESARLIAGLARTVRDVGLAEDLAQDALVAALEQWPSTGVPGNPGAWLNAVARRRYIDGVRRQVSFERKVAEIGRELAEAENPMDEIEFDDHVEDDVLRLIFTACHPALSRDARVALTLKLHPGIDFRDSGIFVVAVRLSGNRWAQYPQGCRSHAAAQHQPMAGFARISVVPVVVLKQQIDTTTPQGRLSTPPTQ